jgi:hypothetical protein
MKWMVMLAVAAALVSCGPNVIILRDPVTHRLATCRYGPLGGDLASKCAAQLEAAGFTRIGAWQE